MQLHTTKMMMGLCVILHIPFGKTWPYLSLSTRMEPRRRKCITIIHPQLQRRPLTLARSFFYALSTSFFGWKSLMRFYYASYSLHWDESVERKVWFPSVVYCMLSLCRQDEDQNCANFAKYPCSCSARLLTTKTLLCSKKRRKRSKDVECEEEDRYPSHISSQMGWWQYGTDLHNMYCTYQTKLRFLLKTQGLTILKNHQKCQKCRLWILESLLGQRSGQNCT
mgnify:CR=1 FL=1